MDPKADASDSNATRANVWPGTWAERSARMLRRDLVKARAAWIDKAATAAELIGRFKSDTLKYTDDDGRVADFHALRHGFISNLARAGVHPKEAQALARHSTITLTMDRYTHFGITDLTAALERLPGLPTAGDSEPQVLRATGTDSERPAMMQPGCNPVALHVAQKVAESSGARGSTVSRNVPASNAGDARRDSAEPEENAVFVERKARVANGTRTRDPQIHNLQTKLEEASEMPLESNREKFQFVKYYGRLLMARKRIELASAKLAEKRAAAQRRHELALRRLELKRQAERSVKGQATGPGPRKAAKVEGEQEQRGSAKDRQRASPRAGAARAAESPPAKRGPMSAKNPDPPPGSHGT